MRRAGAYYNENDPACAQWLRNLIAAGQIAPGEVDARSITDVRASDLAGFRQHHFFAGIGVWSYALRRAGWNDAREVWSGSCPCQPFSQTGARRGFEDARHLWPAWFELIRQFGPVAIFGEQVAGAGALDWFDVVSAELEGAGYAVGATDICAAGFGGPHIRQRLYFTALRLAHDHAHGREGERATRLHGERQGGHNAAGCGAPCIVGDAERARLEGHAWYGDDGHQPGRHDAFALGSVATAGGTSYWSECEWIDCRDGKKRPIESGTFPLAYGAAARVVRLRAYGNAICAPVAEEFIRAVMDAAP